MEFNPQWISLVIQIIILIATVAGFIKVIYNDLTHLNINVAEIKSKQAKIEEQVNVIEKSLYSMKAVCNERHKRSRKTL